MSSDFDKSDDDEGIDFHEAERLSVEHFERTYPEFIALFNRMIREAIDRGEWTLNLPYRVGQIQYTYHAPKAAAVAYLQKIGFDVLLPNNVFLHVSWKRRDGGKYP